jgi:hypothetical protein
MRRVKSNQTKRTAWLKVIGEFGISSLYVTVFSERTKIKIHNLRYCIQILATGASELKPSCLINVARYLLSANRFSITQEHKYLVIMQTI